MSEIAQHTLSDEFRRIDSTRARVVLLEGSDRVLGAFVPRLSERAREQLVRLASRCAPAPASPASTPRA
jgi:NADH dehydrogenase